MSERRPEDAEAAPSGLVTGLPAPAGLTVGDDRNVDEHLDLLRREFEADRGTFLLVLRTQLEWDKAAFSRFEKAMRWACGHLQDRDVLDRWMAEGFYYTSWFVRDWTSHPDSPTCTLSAPGLIL